MSDLSINIISPREELKKPSHSHSNNQTSALALFHSLSSARIKLLISSKTLLLYVCAQSENRQQNSLINENKNEIDEKMYQKIHCERRGEGVPICSLWSLIKVSIT